MSSKMTMGVYGAMIALAMGTSTVWAAKKGSSETVVPQVELNATGQKLLVRYTDQLKTLQAEIEKAVPKVDEQQTAAFLKAYQDESAALAAEVKTMQAGAKSKDKEGAAKAHEAAKAALALATKNAQPLVNTLLPKLEPFLKSDKLDAALVKFVVLTQATPQGLAAFAQGGVEQEALIEKLLADGTLMKQMVLAEGASGGKYGQAMKIYTEIQKASTQAASGPLQRLALGISLEHAMPVEQSNPSAYTNAPTVVDPVKRYLHFEKAFLAHELDPCFKDLTVWDYRNVGNGNETEDILTWGREMLRNYRPDQIAKKDTRWRYVESVKTEVKYGSQDQKNDRPTLHQYQNIIMNGGVCGRRAFFGRFILRCFGVPTLARPQPGHATLVHWSPEGWVINLGASWGWGSVEGEMDYNFLAMTQARKIEASYPEVKRAQWVGMALGEQRAYGLYSKATGFWSGLALYHQRALIEKSKAIALAAVGTDIGEANESKEKDVIEKVTLSDADRKIVIGSDGVITIPATACSKPTASTGKILFMKSYLGGMQLHYSRNGAAEPFEYTLEAPATGKYALTARVVTTSAEQHLQVTVNDSKEPTDISVPFTIGMWDKTPSVEVSLVKGQNVLRFSRNDPIKGLTIKDFTLTPVK